MISTLRDLPIDRVAWLSGCHPGDVERTVATAPGEAPAVICQRVAGANDPNTIVGRCLDELESRARQLFPAWLPGAEAMTTAAGAVPVAVRALALRHAAATAQYGPFLADLATGAITGRKTTRGHPPEVRARGLARVVAASFGRPTCVLLLQLAEPGTPDQRLALVRAAQWLVDHGRLGVWICGDPAPDTAPGVRHTSIDSAARPPVAAHPVAGTAAPPAGTAVPPAGAAAVPRADAAVPSADDHTRTAVAPRRRRHSSTSSRPGVTGKPHPSSQAEVLLEAALASRPWAAGRAWNHTVRPGPLVNPVRVDLLWQRERCIVEIDGDDHRSATKYADDRERDVMLQLNGYAVLRFTNTRVIEDIESVLALIHQFLTSRRRTRKGH